MNVAGDPISPSARSLGARWYQSDSVETGSSDDSNVDVMVSRRLGEHRHWHRAVTKLWPLCRLVVKNDGIRR